MRVLAVGRPLLAASASRIAALFALEAVLIAVLALRLQMVDYMPGLAAIVAAVAVAGLAALLALGAFVVIWRRGSPGFGRAFTGFFIALMLLLPAGFATLKARETPSVADVTTDPDEPPGFTTDLGARDLGAHGDAYDAGNMVRQGEAYPQIRSLLSDLPAGDLLVLARRIAAEKKWMPVGDGDARPAAEGEEAGGQIVFVVRSPWLGTVDDVSIRVREVDGRSRVDMRSAARERRYDFGVNAGRVAEFLETMRTRALLSPADD